MAPTASFLNTKGCCVNPPEHGKLFFLFQHSFFLIEKSFPEVLPEESALFFFSIFFLNVYLFLRQRERQSMNGGGSEREGDTESETGSRLRAVSTEPDAGLEPTDRDFMT